MNRNVNCAYPDAPRAYTEDHRIEDAAMTWFGEVGFAVGHGPQLAPGKPAVERKEFGGAVARGVG